MNAVFNLEGESEIIDLEFLNTIQPPEIEARKESIVDVMVKDQRGSKYIIEMQVAKIAGFEKRAQFYAAKTYCTHFNAGSPYAQLKRVIFLAITSYEVFPEKKHYKSDHMILDNQTQENDLQDFYFTFVELPKFTKKIHELESVEDKWYYFLKHAEESKEVDSLLANNPEINEAYHVLERIFWTEHELQEYDRVAMAVADAKGALQAADQDGHQRGLQEGLQKGREKGEKKAKLALALTLVDKQFSIEQVAELTGLPVGEIQGFELLSRN